MRSGAAIGTVFLLALLIPVVFSTALCQATAIVPTRQASDAVLRIEEMLRQEFKDDEPGITVIAIHDGATVLRAGYGMADIELGVPIRPEMVLRIGSITKQFTAAAIMKLVEAERISLGDSVRKYIAELPEVFDPITIERVLSHTSGMADFVQTERFSKLLNEEYVNFVGEEIDLDLLFSIIAESELQSEPGTAYLYSNSNYFLLAMILEQVSGKSFFEFIKEEICEPAGMSNTYYISNSIFIRGRVPDHLEFEGQLIKNPHRCIGSTLGLGHGGLWSSVDDLALYNRALDSGLIVSGETLVKMSAPYVLDGGRASYYGFGWQTANLKNRPIVYHGGDYLEYSGVMMRVPSENVFLAMLSNDGRKTSRDLELLAKRVAAVLMGDPFPKFEAIEVGRESLERLVGVYQIGEEDFREVIIEDGKIFTQRNGGRKTEAFPASENLFFYDRSLSYFTFEFDERGDAIRMVMHRDTGEEEVAEKVK